MDDAVTFLSSSVAKLALSQSVVESNEGDSTEGRAADLRRLCVDFILEFLRQVKSYTKSQRIGAVAKQRWRSNIFGARFLPPDLCCISV